MMAEDGVGKKCCRCGRQDVPFFHKPRTRDGFMYHCKPCEYQSRGERAGKIKAYRDRRRDYFAKLARDAARARKYGISPAGFALLNTSQGMVCAICGSRQDRRTRGTRACDLDVDHDHATGFVRGLLCNQCNCGIAKFRDNPALLESAATYLKKFQDFLNESPIIITEPCSEELVIDTYLISA